MAQRGFTCFWELCGLMLQDKSNPHQYHHKKCPGKIHSPAVFSIYFLQFFLVFVVFHIMRFKAFSKLWKFEILKAGIYTWFYVERLDQVRLSNLFYVNAGTVSVSIYDILIINKKNI